MGKGARHFPSITGYGPFETKGLYSRPRFIYEKPMDKGFVHVRWMGAAHVELRAGQDVLLIDPYCSRLSKIHIFAKRLLPNIDRIRAYLQDIEGSVRAVAVGHTHFDHALDAPEIARLTRAEVLGCASLDNLFTLAGMPGRVRVCRPRTLQETECGIHIAMIPSRHGRILGRLLLLRGDIPADAHLPLRVTGYRLGSMSSVYVRAGGVSFLHVGSAGFLERELEGLQCDVLFLCAAGWKKSAGYPKRLLDLVRPSCVIPIHHDDFTLPLYPATAYRPIASSDIEGFIRTMRSLSPKTEIRFLLPGAETFF